MNYEITFTVGSPVHIASLAVCAGATALLVAALHRRRDDPAAMRPLRRFVALGSLLSWVVSSAFWLVPGNFRWDVALPLHFCSLSNLIGAAAVWWRIRPLQSLLYFWAVGLSSWAFLTPTLYDGPRSLWFWLFWAYHLFIALTVAFVLAGDRFRPSWRDYRVSLGITLAYSAVLAALNFFTGWNYGFLGPWIPAQTTLLDFLGPYPLRLLSMAVAGSGLFALLVLPWLRRRPSPQP